MSIHYVALFMFMGFILLLDVINFAEPANNISRSSTHLTIQYLICEQVRVKSKIMEYLVDLVSVGGEEKDEFHFDSIANLAILKEIWVWYEEWQIRGIKVCLTDGTESEFGQRTKYHKIFTFEDGERFVSLSLWPNNTSTHVGAIKFKTDRSREFYVKMEAELQQPECCVDVGSGICIGVVGNHCANINKLAFKFLKPIKSAKLMNVQYPTLNNGKPNVAFEKIVFNYMIDQIDEFKVKVSKPITRKSYWSFAQNNQYMVNMEVRAGAPELVEGPGGFSFKVGTESSYGLENSKENTELFTLPLLVPPGKRMDVSATIGRAIFELPFTGTIQVTFSDGGVKDFQTNGTYKGVIYTDAKEESA